MSKWSKQIARSLRSLVLLSLALGLLVACGGEEPTAEVMVVTATFTPQPLVVTATFTPTPEVVPSDTSPPPTDTPLPPPTDAPLPSPTAAEQQAPLEYFTYEHPAGAFSLDIPTDAEVGEDEEGVFYAYGESLVMLFYTPLDAPLGPEDLESLVTVILDDALVGEGLILSYSDLDVQGNEDGDVFFGTFLASSEDHPEGEGIIFVWQVDQTMYFMALLTPDFAEVEEVWDRAIDSLVANPVAPPAPAATPVPPTKAPAPTTPPKPKPSPTTAPPPPQANKGCYLIQNQLGVDLTITFTAQDRQWADTIAIPPDGSKEYCLDPGRYTYTLDAPPPWGSTNGELEVKAGDRFSWPIQGG